MSSFIEKRVYQAKILRLIKESVNENHNVILELDCGMGKRILQYLLVSELFPESKFIILLHSTSSLDETAAFFTEKYKSSDDITFISSRTSSYHRINALQTKRVIGTTPQIFASTLEKLKKIESTENYTNFDFIVINEVDKIIRRMTHGNSVIIFPYNQIINHCNNSIFLGMSGTLRDTHVQLMTNEISIKYDLDSIKEIIPNGAKIIHMEEILTETDANQHLAMSKLISQPVFDEKTCKLIQTIDSLVKELREAILASLEEEDDQILDQLSKENIPWLTQYLPVNSDLKDAYTKLLLVRKYVTAMVPDHAKRFLWQTKEWIDPQLIQALPKQSAKIKILGSILENYNKGVIICSYLKTADAIKSYLESLGRKTLVITGKTTNKRNYLEEYANWNKGILILTPVGERDLDITSGEILISFDAINTTKTMYQRFKRTRGGDVVSLFYSDTSEERKIKRLYKNIKQHYPWSIIVNE